MARKRCSESAREKYSPATCVKRAVMDIDEGAGEKAEARRQTRKISEGKRDVGVGRAKARNAPLGGCGEKPGEGGAGGGWDEEVDQKEVEGATGRETPVCGPAFLNLCPRMPLITLICNAQPLIANCS